MTQQTITSKLRVAAVAVAALVSVGITVQVAATPDAGARPNTGAYKRSLEAQKKKQSDCAADKDIYDSFINDMNRQRAKGYNAAALKSAQRAKDTRDEAKRRGCAWAA